MHGTITIILFHAPRNKKNHESYIFPSPCFPHTRVGNTTPVNLPMWMLQRRLTFQTRHLNSITVSYIGAFLRSSHVSKPSKEAIC